MRMRKYLPALLSICLLQACSWDSELYNEFVSNDVVVPCPPTSFVHYDDNDDAYYLVCVTGYHAVADDNGDYYDSPQYDYCDVAGNVVGVSDRVQIKKNRSGQFTDSNNRVLYNWETFADYIREYHQKPALSYIQMTVKNEDGNIKPLDCSAKYHNDDACPDFSVAFEYSICPNKYNLCLMDEDEFYYCKEPQVECKIVRDCEVAKGWQAGECRNNECIATECKEDYHLSEDVCVADTSECCGAECTNCGANKCVKGVCEAACKYNEHVYGDICEADDVYNCGMHDNNCSQVIAGWEGGECVIPEGGGKKECVPSSCIVGYHLNNKENLDAIDPCTITECDSSKYKCEGEGCDCTNCECIRDCSCSAEDCVCSRNETRCMGIGCSCNAEGCKCTGDQCTCSGKDCIVEELALCTEEKCTRDGETCTCNAEGGECEAEKCHCEGNGCVCTEEGCKCTGSECTCTGEGCTCDDGECKCHGSDCFKQMCSEPEGGKEKICPEEGCAEEVVTCFYRTQDSYVLCKDACSPEIENCEDDCADQVKEKLNADEYINEYNECMDNNSDATGRLRCLKTLKDKFDNMEEDSKCWMSGCINQYSDNPTKLLDCYQNLRTCVLNVVDIEKFIYEDNKLLACLGASCPQKEPGIAAPDGPITPETSAITCVPDSRMQCGSDPKTCACGEVCSMGKCKSNCGSTEVLCKDGANYTCADPMTNVNYCGVDENCEGGAICKKGETCFNGECKTQNCPNSGETLCSVKVAEDSEEVVNKCINIMGVDEKQCGACNFVCSEHNLNKAHSNTCSAGRCIYECDDGYINCGDEYTPDCILEANFQTDANNCGGCGITCKGNEYCHEGKCVTSKCAATNSCLDADSGECVNTATQCGTQCNDCNKMNNAAEGRCEAGVCKITKCVVGYHLKNGICEQDTATACGANTVNCNSEGNATAGVCTAGTCSATACKAGFHLDGGRCVADSETACGSASYSCKSLPGWKAGSCASATCKASACNTNYCLSGTTCMDGVSNSKACGINGGACKTCGAKEACVNGACITSSCNAGVCFYQGKTCSNTNEHCGTNCVNCNTANHAASGTCNAGTCKITACAAGYHLYNNACEADSTTVCGSGRANCNTANHATSGVCSAGSCVARTCATGYHIENGACVVDTITACAGMNCTKLPGWKTGTCTGGVCKATACNANYCISGNNCVDGRANSNTCGISGGACAACNGYQSCVSGACKTTSCAANTCFWQGTSCSNTNDHCGTNCVNCNTANHAATGTCNAGSCKITACAAGYHLYNNACEADSATVCGSSRANCNSANHAASGVCAAGTCVAKTCVAGYHIESGACVADSKTSCAGVNCTKLPGWKDGSCTGGVCKASSCNDNYCISGNNCVVGTSTTNACGKSGGACTNCLNNSNWSNGYCSDGACKLLKCKSGTCMSNNACVNGASNNNTCGTDGNACKKCETGKTCQSGTCKAST